MFLTSDQAKTNAPMFKFTDVDAPEFGEGVRARLRALSLGQQMDISEAARQKEGDSTRNILTLLVASVLVGEDGTQIFDPGKADDLRTLASWPFALVDRIADAANAASGVTKPADETVEDLAGNSDAAPSGGTLSDSPNDSAAPSPS